MQIQPTPFSQSVSNSVDKSPPLASSVSLSKEPSASENRPNHYAQPSAKTEITLLDDLTPQQAQELSLLKSRFPEQTLLLDTLIQKSPSPLLAQDTKGTSTLSHLSELLQSRGVFPEVSTQAMTQQMILRLHDRSEMFQGPQFTCGSAAIQNYMIQNEPAEMVRIMKELATKGQATLLDDSSLNLPDEMQSYLQTQSSHTFEGEKKSTDKRPVADVLFQSAVMKDISIVGGDRGWKGPSKNMIEKGVKALAWLTDLADYDAQNDDSGIMAKLKGNGGGDPILIEKLIEAMTGQTFERDSLLNRDNLWGDKRAFKSALSKVERGKHELLTLLKDPLHYVLMTDFNPQENTVTYLSTGMYHKDSGEASVTEYETVSLNDFLENCGALYSPH